jgi:hypothetical protein
MNANTIHALLYCLIHLQRGIEQICMELLLEYAATFQDKFETKDSLPSSVTFSQFFACFLLPWLLMPRDTVKITLHKSRQMLLSYGLITLLVFGATTLATASLFYVSGI